MKTSIAIFIGLIPLFCSCSKKDTSISVLCEKGLRGNYELKWEIYPDLDNASVEIYSSTSDSVFFSTPTVIANSGDYIAIVNTKDSLSRQFFRLKVGSTYSDIVSNRFFPLDSVHNFRDIGGYHGTDGRAIRWGKIYRSGGFGRMTAHDSEKIKSLHIKTTIDLRSIDGLGGKANPLDVKNDIRIPIGQNSYEVISEMIRENRFMRGDAIIYTQDLYKNIVESNTNEYARFFDYLCDENNYPIVYNCYWGKDQSGLATYFLLRALDVPLETIEEDYLASNQGVKRAHLMRRAGSLSEAGQEALTMISNTDISYLKFALSCIRKKSGSVENYMAKDLRLTPDKRKKLQDILLYPSPLNQK